MSLRIYQNVGAVVAHHKLQINDNNLSRTLEHLASGLRIMRASDDAASLSMSERMRAQYRGLDQATSNAQDAHNMLGTAEGALNETHVILQRMRELAVQGATDTLTLSDRVAVKQELDTLSQEIDRIGRNTEFNTLKLLDGGTFAQLFTLQVGANSGDIHTMSISDMRAAALNVATTNISVDNPTNASAAISAIDVGIERVSRQRSYLGAKMNALEHNISTLQVQAQNTKQSENRIRDLDFAKASSELTRHQMLQQSSLAMLSQANQQPQGVLGLLR